MYRDDLQIEDFPSIDILELLIGGKLRVPGFSKDYDESMDDTILPNVDKLVTYLINELVLLSDQHMLQGHKDWYDIRGLSRAILNHIGDTIIQNSSQEGLIEFRSSIDDRLRYNYNFDPKLLDDREES